ncbi:hypothetical protein [Rubinisphaera margarita]|uniref:hypothetical protein n=1 Tax=Rubinisphaera margarita TaxID=2909586 RepID=UPI001EE7AF83|nr:hypothetical protein [Rubinisphaera margarita]MCG6157911.1 hypothetical protein [Rubinisphaera margarita]
MLNGMESTFIIFGIILLSSGLLLWKTNAARNRIARQDPIRDLARERDQKAQSPEAYIHDMEVRLFDYGREVEGRVETTLTLLDRLIMDAESEVTRLEDLLSVSRVSSTSEPVNQERLRQLIAAGLTDEEISRCLRCNIETVQTARLGNGPGREAA